MSTRTGGGEQRRATAPLKSSIANLTPNFEVFELAACELAVGHQVGPVISSTKLAAATRAGRARRTSSVKPLAIADWPTR
jgi:hypothetical protein